MATNGALPFFFVFLLFFLSFSQLSHCHAAAARPAVSSARAAAIQYWNLKFPKTVMESVGCQELCISSQDLLPADTAAVDEAIAHCKMPANIGETKRCVASAEDMMHFVVESLGSDHNVQARSTTSSNGHGRDVLIGDVKAVDDGPKTRLYEADMLEIGTKEKSNHATAIYHGDTSDWSADHAAFVALGSAPGKIEVCHWISPRDIAWTSAVPPE